MTLTQFTASINETAVMDALSTAAAGLAVLISRLFTRIFELPGYSVSTSLMG